MENLSDGAIGDGPRSLHDAELKPRSQSLPNQLGCQKADLYAPRPTSDGGVSGVAEDHA